MNTYYQTYHKEKAEVNAAFLKYNADSGDAKKLNGLLAANLLRRELVRYFLEHALPYTVSPVNSYVIGSKYEYDLLIVKADAQPFSDYLYTPDDVITVIESKAGGLMNVKNECENIAQAFNAAHILNRTIRFGYITVGENVPVHEVNRLGNPTVNHWELTQYYFKENLDADAERKIYAATLHKGNRNNLCDEGSDEAFLEFIEALLPLENAV